MSEERIVGGCSLFDREQPELCKGNCNSHWRCVDCCKREKGRDVVECSTCGKQKSVSCSFDEDYA